MSNIAYEIVSSREVLHKAAFEAGPRITKVETIRINGDLYEVSYWTQGSKVVKVDSHKL